MRTSETAFGRHLRQLRLRAGLSQEALAERAGLAPRAIAALERGDRRSPYAKTVGLLAEALGLSAAERAAFAGAASNAGSPLPGRLPRTLTSLIGREQDQSVAARLLAGGTRLLSFTGPGGTGKTRLALAVAERVRHHYPSGAFFVDLSSVERPDAVLPAIAQVLSLREGEGLPFAAALDQFLIGKHLLLVLDNFEQVIDAAPLLPRLLREHPRLTVLVTSRRILHVSGEQEYQVRPLPLPSAAEVADLAALAVVPSVALFLERARTLAGDFELTDDSSQAVAAICAHLDGLPLALELAAARIRLLSPRALLARLEQRLPLLTGGPRDLPARQQTLRDAIAWSYDLLAPEEKTLFRRLGVVVGSCTLAAAMALLASMPDARDDSPSDTVPGAELSVLNCLGALIEHNLLRKEDGPDGEPRFLMLSTVREFALEQLAGAGEAVAVRTAHAAYYLALAEEAAAACSGPLNETWLDQLERDHDNLRVALDWLVESGEGARAVQLAGALWRFWNGRAYLREGRDRLARALAVGGGNAAIRVRALEGAGYLHSMTGETATGVRLLEEAVALREAAGDETGLLESLNWLGNVLLWTDPDQAYAVHARVLESRRSSGDDNGVVSSLVNLGIAALIRGDGAEATSLLGPLVTSTGRLQVTSAYGLAVCHVHLAWAAILQGNLKQAAHWLRHALPHLGSYRHMDHVFLIAAVVGSADRPSDAVRLFAAAETAAIQAGGHKLPGSPLNAVREQQLEALRTRLGERAFTAAWAEGGALSADVAFALALTGLEQTLSATSSC